MIIGPSRQILVFGGSFSPPTLAHQALIAACLRLPGFESVWLMPSGDRLDKHMSSDDTHRLRMLAIMQADAFAGTSRLHLTDFELRMPRPTNTYDTLRALKAAYPTTTFWFALGMDSYLDMPNWPHGAELIETLPVVLFDRAQRQHVEGPNALHLRLPDKYAHISSTSARQTTAQGRALDGLVSKPVASYIKRHHLYRAG